jgi:predicted nucleic acid-binding protein
MKFLLDTCVISALRKPQENASLVEWISEVDESDLYLSAITIGELEKGASRLPESKKKTAVSEWIRHAVAHRFGNRILPIDAAVAACWGELIGAREQKGKTLPILDAFIAATAITADCTIVTRNTKDFADCGVPLLNP